MTLTVSGPITSSRAGQVIRDKNITVADQDAITILHDNVRVENCVIRHGVTGMNETSRGIFAGGVRNPEIYKVDIAQQIVRINGSQSRSPNSDNILLESCSADPAHPSPAGVVKPTIRGVRCQRGSRLIKATQCVGGGAINNVELHRVCGLSEDISPDDFGGNAIQFDNCPGWGITDVSYEDADSSGTVNQSWTEDLFSIYFSDNVTVQRVFGQRCNSPSGDNFMAEGSKNCRFIDCDATWWGNGAFGFTNGATGVLSNCRAKYGVLEGLDGRGPPSSNGLMIAVYGSGSSAQITNFQYFQPADQNNLLWDANQAPGAQLVRLSTAFTNRPVIRVVLPS